MTPEQLKEIMPSMPLERARALLPALVETCQRFGITTRLQVAAFLAQTGMESGAYRYLEELATGEDYEGRAGNPQPGDGRRYKGRGWIQLTFRLNYRKAGRELGLNLEENPEQVARYPAAALVSGWFWRRGSASGDLNVYADIGPQVVPPDSPVWARVAGGKDNFFRKWRRDVPPTGFDICTYGVNGGFNGKDARDAIYARALQVLPENPLADNPVFASAPAMAQIARVSPTGSQEQEDLSLLTLAFAASASFLVFKIVKKLRRRSRS